MDWKLLRRAACGAVALLVVLPVVAQTSGVGAQYDSAHVYVAPADVAAFARCFLGTFGGVSTKQVVSTVTPTPSSTTSQILQTPSGIVSLFGFTTPVPAPFGAERTGFLVRDLDVAIGEARAAGAEVVVAAFPDPVGRDAIVRFPGGVMTQLYWHTKAPSYAPLAHLPENRVYVSLDAAGAFVKSYLQFSGGRIEQETLHADGATIGRTGYFFRELTIRSAFGLLKVLVTDGALPWPYGRETTGYAVADLSAALQQASSLGAIIEVKPDAANGHSAMVRFPGGYLAELHQDSAAQ
ncbi:MAG: glyoxalase [Acidobacteriaceae bacterium]|nr:glyoxalase [Acidobacteriaceae bacterium]